MERDQHFTKKYFFDGFSSIEIKKSIIHSSFLYKANWV